MNRAAVAPVLLTVMFVMILAMPPVTTADDDDRDFELGGTATGALDPADPGNDVISMSVTPGPTPPATFGFVRRRLDRRTQVEDLTHQLSFHFRFAAGGSCGGGSPRIQLAIDTDGDRVSNGNAFGHVGPFPTFTGCPANAWQFEDLTDTAMRWDLTQFNDDLAAIGQPSVGALCGSFVCTWAQMLTVFGNFPNHRVLRGGVFDDTFPGSGRGSGLAFYDNIEVGDEKLHRLGAD